MTVKQRLAEALEPFAETYNGMPHLRGLNDEEKIYLSYAETRVHHIALTFSHFHEALVVLSGVRR